ncbi:MAG TPA: flagellar motor switch phosphatase FliY [Epulopiscium sp.]|nr:flagellar motor switch phosphatase FliY [Candidatus Epulonipiscium sp.]
MSEGVLSQDEINALLGMASGNDDEIMNNELLTDEEKDAIGEIGNISMGTSATTLFTLLNQKVSITTPRVKVWEWEDFLDSYPDDIVIINVDYKEGLTGTNLLLLKEEDVKKITDIMMGGDGTNITGELTEIHLSAIAEAMNQMVGSASTSMSQMLDMKIDISPPQAFMTTLDTDKDPDTNFAKAGIVQVAFSMKIGDIIDSEIMQILPIQFAKEMVQKLMNPKKKIIEDQIPPITPDRPQVAPQRQTPPAPSAPVQSAPMQSTPVQQYAAPTQQEYAPNIARDIDVQTPQFPSFDDSYLVQQKENMDIIMDVPLEVTVELGRTSKKIKDILEFNPGTVIELDRLAGEPIDILVNGKYVAQGEVVVIDENFGIRITEIISPENRI